MLVLKFLANQGLIKVHLISKLALTVLLVRLVLSVPQDHQQWLIAKRVSIARYRLITQWSSRAQEEHTHQP